jgi:glucan phosphoethanolaminetransferase (alkaline phosphatase superfamily)
MSLAVVMLLLGTFYGQQINTLLAVGGDGAAEFVKLAFFWGGIFGATAIMMISYGLLRRSPVRDNTRLLPSLILLVLLLTLFFSLFYRSIFSPPQEKPLRPGETLII